jgi:methyl-accepting chemotaxis protein
MGFAVVAEEVRALAGRSAQAARETAERIEGSIKKTAQGVQISEKVGLGLAAIAEKVRQVDQLISDVASASGQQNEGIGHLNTAISQMDQVTQQNAAAAEEGASASEELAAQAVVLGQAVDALHRIVEGGRGSRDPQPVSPEFTGVSEGRNSASGKAPVFFDSEPDSSPLPESRKRVRPARGSNGPAKLPA